MLAPLRVVLVALACVLALCGATPTAVALAGPEQLSLDAATVETVPPARALFASDLRPAGTWMVTARTRVRHGAGRRPLDGVVPPRPRGTRRELREGVERITHLALASAGAARVPQPRGPPAS